MGVSILKRFGIFVTGFSYIYALGVSTGVTPHGPLHVG